MNSPLPQGWAEAKIGDLITLNPKNKARDDIKAAFMPMSNLGVGYLDVPTFEVRQWGQISKNYVHFAQGDVLLAKITPCFENGKAGIASGLPCGIGAGSSEFFVCRPDSGALLAEWLLALFKTSKFLQDGAQHMTGSVGHKRVPKDFVHYTLLPLPPMAEQRRIVAKLNTLLARVDGCRERLERVGPLIKRFRQSVLAAATSGELTAEWRHQRTAKPWSALELGDVATDVRYGTSKKCDYASGSRGVLRIPNINSAGGIDQSDLKFAEFDATEIDALSLRVGDLLVIRSNGSLDLVGRTAVVDENSVGLLYAGYLIRLRLDQKRINPMFAYYCMASPLTRHNLTSAAKSTSGVNNVNAGELRGLPISLPSLDEQREIVRRVNKLMQWCGALEGRLHGAVKCVDSLTPATLAKAFRGELVPQDPNDEPAEALLARIRAEREGAAATAPRRRRTSGTTT